MLKFSWPKKLVLLIIACTIIVFVAGAVFVYKTNRNSVSDESSRNSLPASIGNLGSGSETAGQKIETLVQSIGVSNAPPQNQAGKHNNNDGNTSVAQNNKEESAPANQISVAFFVGDKKYETSVPENSSVYDLMEKLQKESDFRFSGKNYSGLGFFVEEINGIKNNPKNSQYWIYYVNGQEANMGISGLKVKQGDIITWEYESSR